jgi:hypothetical protein
MSPDPSLPDMSQAQSLPPRLKLLLATADTATQRNDRILGVQCILQIFAGFDRSAAEPAETTNSAATCAG